MTRRGWRQVRPILRALIRHKTSAVLIVLQVALTLAVVSNAMFIVATRVVHLSRPTGTDEANIFAIVNQWPAGEKPEAIAARMRGDLAALRELPGVHDAFASEAYPLEGGMGVLAGLKLAPEQTNKPQFGIMYFADEHAIETFGTHLIAGRNFRAEEVIALGPFDTTAAPVIIVTSSLAHKLFPATSALGKTVYLTDGPANIIGIVDSLQGPYAGSTTRSIDEDSVLYPARSADPAMGTVYIVRARPGAIAEAIPPAIAALWGQSEKRLIDPETGVVTLAQAREQGYAIDRSVALMMGMVSVLLLLATGAGIVGLSSFWVSQRRRQIGIRRALGASRADILAYFQTENLLLVTAGIFAGGILAYAGNLQLMKAYELNLMPWYIVPCAAATLWLLGQSAVYGPARRAVNTAPVEAIRKR